MIRGIVYFILPFLMAFPAVVAFVKWRNASFKNKLLAFEFLGFFSFFFFNILFTYQYLYSEVSYHHVFKILAPFFFLFLIQKDLSYAIEKERLKRLLILMIGNAILQIMIYMLLPGLYIHELLDLLALLFCVYVSFRIAWEYHVTAYVPKLSRYVISAISILCILFDVYVFNLLLISAIFYASLEKRQLELSGMQRVTENLLIGQNRFRSMMSELSSSIKDFSNKKDAANSYLDSLCRFLSVRGAAIYEWDGERKLFSCISIAGLYFPLGIGSEKLFTRPDLLKEMAFKQHIKDYKSLVWKCGHSEDRQGMLLNHTTDDMDAMLGNLSQEVHSIILLPLLQDSDLLGVLILENKVGSDYLTEADFNMARNFANFAAIILSTSRIAAQRSENLRMSTELISGNVVQSALFSQIVPELPGIEVSYFMLPAKEIGGDYYDFLENGDKLAVAIGDVSGKGVSAGILVAIIQTYLQNQYKEKRNLKNLIIDLNTYLYNKISTGMFVTLLFFEWNSKRNKLHYVSCGHEHILHYHAKEKTVECIRSGGLALMMDADIEPYITDNELAVKKGDAIILYTDGVIETFNSAREIFGLDRLVKFFESSPTINRYTIEKQLPQVLTEWRGDAANQTDDITCVLMRF
jgi:serine phosphatase RsbU (regulator of sigma subunit)